mmetsp:Transcript_18949/g.24382  ORF Transcript_18949/g.24382 Transcript_18949/m.24382 type:complete len:155 (-) Transcript_18949:138-602(-)|eukprot:CAMPEP_0198147074 /NCGR_PEP_ID=MMETSP1443-20131203/33189_1 /TAXON_ID=186043 /ORGANISM="Entomoneis sp., Strain CCMP2396" /LENGTH=154 /DNA_ID=CAMNT_0043811229 /DNA_START=281 /DNA_END=745 /DNA_ORIENTATION=-
MTSKHRLTRSFRTISALMYLANIAVSVHFAWVPQYLHILAGVTVALASTIMLFVAIESPSAIVDKLERSSVGIQLFTFRGRYMMDLFISLYLFAMPPWGVIMGTVTFSLIFGIRVLGMKQPDAFNEIFRQSDIESQSDSYTMESEYDTPVAERQ